VGLAKGEADKSPSGFLTPAAALGDRLVARLEKLGIAYSLDA
jgi:short subunit dehydrogenase-like uncharacterized protein